MNAANPGQRAPRGRPPGLAPRGTTAGLAGIMLLSLVAPVRAVMIASPWLASGLHAFIGVALPAVFACVAVSFLSFIPLAAGLKTRRYWVVCWYLAAGVVWLALYAAVLVLALAGPLHLVRERTPELAGVAWLWRLFLLLALPMAILTVRALRLKYWQPWTTPDQWEAGNERTARWAYAASGVSPPKWRR